MYVYMYLCMYVYMEGWMEMDMELTHPQPLLPLKGQQGHNLRNFCICEHNLKVISYEYRVDPILNCHYSLEDQPSYTIVNMFL